MYRRITASCIILFMLFSGFRSENFERTGLLGNNVTLPSGVNKPGNLPRIEWSRFNNQSYIATFHGDEPEYFRQQSQRLKLNITTGDLEIMDLHREDSGTYTVHVRNTEGVRWDNKIILSVQEWLPEPKITVINSTVQHGICKIFLTCSVKSQGKAMISWSSEAFPHGCVIGRLPYAATGWEAEAWCSPTNDVNITCSANDRLSNAASTVTTGCSRNDPVPTESPPSSGSTNPFLIGVIIILCFILMYIKREALSEFGRTSWKRLTEWLPFLAKKSDDEDEDTIYDNNMAQAEKAPGQVSTYPESQQLQICGDEDTINDNDMALPEEESGKKKENSCDDTQPKETEIEIPDKVKKP